MGIDPSAADFLRICTQHGVDFAETLMLGRQELTGNGYAEPFFTGLGAQRVDSLDASSFEDATVVADLNKPLPPELRQQYTAVFDGGTLEHVFDVATALRSCLDLVQLGGHYIAISPANNWPGHGFYQFSPELMFGVLSDAAGFRVRGMFAAEVRRPERWYVIPDPHDQGRRVYWRNRFRTHLVTVAQRVDVIELSAYTPQQSDYAARWSAARSEPTVASDKTFKQHVWRLTPSAARNAYNAILHRREERFDPAVFTRINRMAAGEHFRPVEPAPRSGQRAES